MARVDIERPGNPQVTDQICARICARNAAGRVETGETPKIDVDPRRASAEVSTATGNRARHSPGVSTFPDAATAITATIKEFFADTCIPAESPLA